METAASMVDSEGLLCGVVVAVDVESEEVEVVAWVLAILSLREKTSKFDQRQV